MDEVINETANTGGKPSSSRSVIRMEGITSSKALDRSKKRQAVALPRVKLVWISVVRIERLS